MLYHFGKLFILMYSKVVWSIGQLSGHLKWLPWWSGSIYKKWMPLMDIEARDPIFCMGPYTVVQWTWAPAFPQFWGPSEGSEPPNSCSIWLPLVSGFYRVVKHHFRLIYTHFVAVFRGKSDLLKIRKKLKCFCFWQNVYIKKMHFLLFLWTKGEIF